MNTSMQLHTYRGESTESLEQAVGQFLDAIGGPAESLTTVALLSAPGWFSLAGVERDSNQWRIRAESDGRFNIAEAYEARVFNTKAELRWYRPQGSRRGQAVWLTQEPLAGAAGGPDASVSCTCVLPQKYLLWGQVMNVSHPTTGWYWMAEHRIRRFAVRLGSATAGAYAQLHALEYLAIDARGNVSVVNECLTELTVLPA